MIFDSYNRKITYLRVSITDRCNLRCFYCIPKGDIKFKEKREFLSFEEIERVLKIFVQCGIEKIRITGGEPLLRTNFVDFIKRILKIQKIKDLSITTNGLLLKKFAKELKDAGLNRLNISLDTLNPDKFRKITKLGELSNVLDGIELAKNIGFSPIKINVVVLKGINDDELVKFIEFSQKFNLIIRFIEYMPSSVDIDWKKKFFSRQEILSKIAHLVYDSPTEFKAPPEISNGIYLRVKGTQNFVGLISPISHNFCSMCNRFRLTADGNLRVCLFNNLGIDIKTLMRTDCSNEELRYAIFKAARLKPKIGLTNTSHTKDLSMYQIGG